MFRSQHHKPTATNIERNVFMTRVDTCLSSWDKLSKETKQQLRQSFAQHESSVTPSWFIAALRTNVVPTRRTHTSLPYTSIYVSTRACAYPKNLTSSYLCSCSQALGCGRAVRLRHSTPSRSSDLVIQSPNIPQCFIIRINQTNHKRARRSKDVHSWMCPRECVEKQIRCEDGRVSPMSFNTPPQDGHCYMLYLVS